MNRHIVLDNLYINTRDCTSIAEDYDLGLEIIEYVPTHCINDFEALKDKVSERINGIKRIVLHGPICDDIPSEDGTLFVSEILKTFNKTFNIARYHGIDRVVFHSHSFSETLSFDRWIYTSAAFWKKFMEDKPSNFYVFIENVCEDEPRLFEQLINQIDDPRVSICLDIGHANVNSSRCLQEWIEILNKNIGHVHLHNNDGISDKHWSLNKGKIDMEKTLDLLIKYAPNTTYTLECNAADSLAWLFEKYAVENC